MSARDAVNFERRLRAGHDAKRLGRFAEARGHFEGALQIMPEEALTEVAASIFRWIAWAHASAGDPEAAMDCLEASEAVACAAGDPIGVASALNTRAGTLFGLGRLDESEELFAKVRSIARDVADRKLEAMAQQNLGSVASIRGDLEVALGRFEASRAAFEEVGELDYVGPLLNNMGRLQIELGEDRRAEKTLVRARRLCERSGDKHHLVIVGVNLAWVLLRTGRVMDALRTAEEARQLADGLGDDRWLAENLLVIGACHLRLGNARVALGFLERASGLARQRGDVKTLADVVLHEAEALRRLDRNRETLRRLDEAKRLFEKLRARRDLAQVGERLDRLEETFLRIVAEWGESIERKDPYTQGHSKRVAEYACALARATGFPEADMRWFRMGALLHDVGKVAIPLDILNSRGGLSGPQWDIMRSHSVVGVTLLEGIEFPWDIRPMIRHHHERFDGSGYPDGKAGFEIPLAARILTIADIYDALTTTRSYRESYSHQRALEIMREEAGQTIDPDIFAVFERDVAPRLGERAVQRPRRRAAAGDRPAGGSWRTGFTPTPLPAAPLEPVV